MKWLNAVHADRVLMSQLLNTLLMVSARHIATDATKSS